MKIIYFLMVGVMLTGCGSASITPEIIPEHVTDGIVDVRDLPTVLTRPRDVIGSGTLIVPPEDFNPTDLRDGHVVIESERLNRNVITYRRGGNNSENPDGFVTFETGIPEVYTEMHTWIDGTVYFEPGLTRYNEPVFYIGILSTTNLGAPLTETPATAIWPGHFYAWLFGRSVREADFYVDFTNGHFGFHDGNNGIGESHNNWGGSLGGGGTVISTIDGYFGNHPKAEGLTPGQMVGTFTSDWSGIPVYGGYYESTLIGLIGEEGAVGVFGAEIGKDDRPMIGGFTATNPSYTPPMEN